MLETVEGLFALADATGDRKYAEWGLDATFWASRNAYLSDGLFRDAFDVKTATVRGGALAERQTRPSSGRRSGVPQSL